MQEIQRRRVRAAFDLIAKANTVTILSLNEMEALVLRALQGEFDREALDSDERLSPTPNVRNRDPFASFMDSVRSVARASPIVKPEP